jgi:hypothetical protein
MNPKSFQHIFEWGSRLIFAGAASLLALLAVVLAVDAAVQFVRAALSNQDIGIAALKGIGYVVVAIAVFDVAGYLIEEEVVRGRELRVAAEARRSLTRFISTIAIAVFLESLVTIFRVSQENVSELLYPTALLVAAILLIVGLGIYQRLSASIDPREPDSEKATRPVSKSENRPANKSSDKSQSKSSGTPD